MASLPKCHTLSHPSACALRLCRSVLGNAAHDRQQFEAVVRTARALLSESQLDQAGQLARRSMAAFACKDRCWHSILHFAHVEEQAKVLYWYGEGSV